MTSAIRVLDVSKRFRVPLDRSNTLKYRVAHLRSSSRYRDLLALRNISFDVPRGEFLGIIGNNGCGKSTLLKLLARIYLPTAGSIDVRGKVAPFLELGVGFNPELTARENIYLNGAVLGITRGELRTRADRIVAFAGLEEFADQKIKNFSSGMEVRLAFSVAVEAHADILLMDEVLAVGDANFQLKCFDVFARYKREGRTIVLVTHDLGSVERHCDRVLLLDHGAIVADGDAATVTTLYRRLVAEQAQAAAGADGSEAEAGPGHPARRPDRWGTGEVLITDVAFLDGEEQPRHTFETGAPLTIRLRLTVHQSTGEEIVVAVAVHGEDGGRVAEMTTLEERGRHQCPSTGASLVVDYRIPSLSLLTGRYAVSVGVRPRARDQPWDLQEGAHHFDVVDHLGRPGRFTLGGSWTVTAREPATAPAGGDRSEPQRPHPS